MNRYLKISAALAAFALLLVVMGLSTQNDGERAAGDCGGHCCSFAPFTFARIPSATLAGDTPDATTDDNVFTLSFPGETVVTIQNLDLPRVTQKVDVKFGGCSDRENRTRLY